MAIKQHLSQADRVQSLPSRIPDAVASTSCYPPRTHRLRSQPPLKGASVTFFNHSTTVYFVSIFGKFWLTFTREKKFLVFLLAFFYTCLFADRDTQRSTYIYLPSLGSGESLNTRRRIFCWYHERRGILLYVPLSLSLTWCVYERAFFTLSWICDCSEKSCFFRSSSETFPLV